MLYITGNVEEDLTLNWTGVQFPPPPPQTHLLSVFIMGAN